MLENVRSGRFFVSPDRLVYGELRGSDEKVSLYLWDEDFFIPATGESTDITGTLHDLTKVTLLYCFTSLTPGWRSSGEQSNYFATLHPRFVLEGSRHIDRDALEVSELQLVLDDAPILFCDKDAFGSVLDANVHIKNILESNKAALLKHGVDHALTHGPEPQIVYFSGKRDIIEVETSVGTVSVRHNPRGSLVGSPRGVRIENTISLSLHLNEALSFPVITRRAHLLLQFFTLLAGRPQLIDDMAVKVHSTSSTGHEWLNVHWVDPPYRDQRLRGVGRKPHPADCLLDPLRDPDDFSKVLRTWLLMDEERRDSRGQFFRCFADQDRYSVDRLVAAANMFDILPTSASPRRVTVRADLLAVRNSARKLFLDLSRSDDRDRMLDALGRLGVASLLHKIKDRAARLQESVPHEFPEWPWVMKQAVMCRNHYVHGTESKIDYQGNPWVVAFFTETLEFIFGASELVECGWNLSRYFARANVGHPFGMYRANYAQSLSQLKTLIENDIDS